MIAVLLCLYPVVGSQKKAVVSSTQLDKINVNAPIYLQLRSQKGVILNSTALANCNGLLAGYIYIPEVKFRYSLQGSDANGNPFSVVKSLLHTPLPPRITPNYVPAIPPTLTCKCYNGGTCKDRYIRRRKLTTCLCPPGYRGSLCQDGKIYYITH